MGDVVATRLTSDFDRVPRPVPHSLGDGGSHLGEEGYSSFELGFGYAGLGIINSQPVMSIVDSVGFDPNYWG